MERESAVREILQSIGPLFPEDAQRARAARKQPEMTTAPKPVLASQVDSPDSEKTRVATLAAVLERLTANKSVPLKGSVRDAVPELVRPAVPDVAALRAALDADSKDEAAPAPEAFVAAVAEAILPQEHAPELPSSVEAAADVAEHVAEVVPEAAPIEVVAEEPKAAPADLVLEPVAESTAEFAAEPAAELPADLTVEDNVMAVQPVLDTLDEELAAAPQPSAEQVTNEIGEATVTVPAVEDIPAENESEEPAAGTAPDEATASVEQPSARALAAAEAADKEEEPADPPEARSRGRNRKLKARRSTAPAPEQETVAVPAVAERAPEPPPSLEDDELIRQIRTHRADLIDVDDQLARLELDIASEKQQMAEVVAALQQKQAYRARLARLRDVTQRFVAGLQARAEPVRRGPKPKQARSA